MQLISNYLKRRKAITSALGFNRGDVVAIEGIDEAKLINSPTSFGGIRRKLKYFQGTIQEFTLRRPPINKSGFAPKDEHYYAHVDLPNGIYTIPVNNLKKVVDN